MGILIRRAVPGDAEAIARVLMGAFREFEPLYTPAGYRATTPTAAEIVARFGEGPVWVACDGDAVVGTVGAVARGDEAYVRSMAVVPEARGRGIAGLLMAAVQAHAAGHGCTRLTLSTTPFLAGAIALYERLGFRRTGELDLYGTPLIAMVLENMPGGTGNTPPSS